MNQSYKVLEIDPNLEPLHQKMEIQEAQETLRLLTKNQILFFKELSNKPRYLDKYKNLRNNQFAEAIRLSYQYHVPLILSPDDLWLVISQGFGIHVNMNAEKLRKQFVDFDGKKKLEIFVESVQSIVWPDIFKTFSQLIRENVGDVVHSKLVQAFSIDNPIFQSVQEIQLMDSMKSYFEYGIVCCCGIPKVKFLGTLDDWIKLRDATQQLAQFDLDWWIQKLVPILDKLIDEYKAEKGDQYFWNNIYQMRNGMSSGPPPQTATGWITLFYPYTKLGNSFIKNDHEMYYQVKNTWDTTAFDPESIPSGLSKTPIELDDHGTKYDLIARAGFVKVNFEDGFIRPEIGYIIIGKLQGQKKKEQEQEQEQEPKKLFSRKKKRNDDDDDDF